jgi:hypothetical protein
MRPGSEIWKSRFDNGDSVGGAFGFGEIFAKSGFENLELGIAWEIAAASARRHWRGVCDKLLNMGYPPTGRSSGEGVIVGWDG